MLAEQVVGEDVGGQRRVLVHAADAHALAVGAGEDLAQIVAAGGRHAVAQAREFGDAAAEAGIGVGLEDLADQVEVHDLVRRADDGLLGGRRAQADDDAEHARFADVDAHHLADLRRHGAGETGAVLGHVQNDAGTGAFDGRHSAKGYDVGRRSIHESAPNRIANA